MFSKNLLTALLVIAGAASSQALRTVSPKQIPSIFNAGALANPSSEVTYTVQLRSAGQDALDSKMLEIAQSGGQWLSDDELAGYTAASDSDLAAVKSYLTQHGGKNISVNKWGDKVTVTQTIEQANAAWQANLTQYSHANSGRNIVRTKQYSIPDALESAVLNVYPFTSFDNPRRAIPIGADKRQPVAPRTAGSSVCDDTGYTIPCIKSQYGSDTFVPQPTNDTVDTLVMGYIGEYVSELDLAIFMAENTNQTNYKIDIEVAGGAINDEAEPGDESMLDVEMVSGITAPLATTFLSFGPADEEDANFFINSLEYVLLKK